MEKQMERPKYGMVFFLLGVLCLCVLFAGEIRLEMQNALTRCLTVIIPSLYAMMILSQLLIATGIWRVLAKPLHRLTPKLFGLPDACFALFLLSQFAGYPIGASMLRTLTENGTLRREDAGRMLCVCYGGGPAFLLGLLGEIPCRSQMFLLIFSTNILSNLLLCMVLFRHHPVQLQHAGQMTSSVTTSASLLVQCTADAGRILLQLCGIILCFSAICAFLDVLGLFRMLAIGAKQLHLSFSVTDIARSILEITNAVELSLPFSVRIPVFTALLSFGGCCVILQIRAVSGDVIPMRHFILMRGIAAGLSALFCTVGMHFLLDISLDSTATAASATATVSKSPIFPTIMLLIMMMLVFREEHLLQKKSVFLSAK